MMVAAVAVKIGSDGGQNRLQRRFGSRRAARASLSPGVTGPPSTGTVDLRLPLLCLGGATGGDLVKSHAWEQRVHRSWWVPARAAVDSKQAALAKDDEGR
jgi:hypothetical protein